MPPDLEMGSILFQSSFNHVNAATISVFSNKNATINIALKQDLDGGLMNVLPAEGWKLRANESVEFELPNDGFILDQQKLNKIWYKQIAAGQSVAFTPTTPNMRFAIFVSDGWR